MHQRLCLLLAGACGTLTLTSCANAATTDSGAAYLSPSTPGVTVRSLLASGDKVGGYRMVGKPDGLGVTRRGRELIVSMNHELSADEGVVRRHGAKGAFVSRWTLSPDGRVLSGRDLMAAPVQFAGPERPFGRFCSASLATARELSSPGRGVRNTTIFFPGEEQADAGRVIGILDDGTTRELPRLGLASWENHVVAATGTAATVVVSGEDNGAAQLWVYHGTKSRTGDAFRRAGLTNGTNHVLQLHQRTVATDADFRRQVGRGKPARFHLSAVASDAPGAQQNADAKASGLTLNRIEDVVFDPTQPNVGYFATTVGGGTASAPGTRFSRDGGGIWRVQFDDISRPERGGTLTLILDGSEAPYLYNPDNLTMDELGNLLVQEDPGASEHRGRIIAVNTRSGYRRAVLAQFNAAQFHGPDALTTVEESSGIVAVPGQPGTFLFTAQAHTPVEDPELVERGQLLMLTVKSWRAVYRGSSATGGR